jgi:hypothetical protein
VSKEICLTGKLEELATTFRENREEAAASVERAVMCSMVAEEALIEAKKQVKHGQWLPWLGANCDISERTARSYMQLARGPLKSGNALPICP